MQYRAVFGTVNFFTGEHRLDSAGQIGLFRQILQLRQRLFSDAVLGEVHQHQIVKSGGEFRETIAIFGEKLADSDVFHFIEVFL